MWLVEDTVQLPRRDEYNRKVIKDEINRVLNGYQICIDNGIKIVFCEKGVNVNGKFVETYSGPNRTYREDNPFEICICVCQTGKSEINSELAIRIAKEIKKDGKTLKGQKFITTCDNINVLLGGYGFKLIILYTEQSWVMNMKKNPKSRQNYTPFITYFKKKKEQEQNQNINEKGCYVLYGI